MTSKVRSLSWKNHTQWPELSKSAVLLLLLLMVMPVAELRRVLRHANRLHRIYPLFFCFPVTNNSS